MPPLKLMTILGTRPEIIRLSACLPVFDRCFRHVLVHTGQNWDACLNQVFFDDLSLRKPDYSLHCAGDSLGKTLGNILSESYEVLRRENPDAVLILGDTNSALSAIPAKRLKIPVFHMEAGNRCFDENVPEEINRRMIDHISDVNLPYTEHSRRYLLGEGLRGDRIFVTGSPMAEVLQTHMPAIEASDVLERLRLRPGRYMVLSAHREENIDSEENFIALMTAVNRIAARYEMPVVYSVHPRSAKYIERRHFQFHPLVRRLEPFGFSDYNKLQKNSFCVLSDSGTLSEESAILGFDAVLLRTSTERPEALDKGRMVIGGIHGDSITQAVELTQAMHAGGEPADPVPDYRDRNVSAKVARIIQSYTGIIDRDVWRKHPPEPESE